MSAELADDDDDSLRGPDLIGEVLANRYLIESRLGEGAMGAVFKARHVKVGRPFAVKVLHKKLIEDRKVLQRFEREAELAGRLRHPNVVGVVDVGETTDGFRYMVMDFAEGNDLATMLNEAPMKADRIINLTRQMLEGLFHAHEQGLIHRDFKPENVIIERDDHGVEVPRIVDFGIAILREGGDGSNAAGRLTTNGLVLGTPHYMAPEQAVADPIDHRIDLFALGIVVYEMLCGKLPFDGTGAEVARANLLLDPPLIAQRVPFLEIDPLLEAFSRRLMAKKREMRPATAKAARELLDLITSDPAAAAAALGVPLASSRMPAITQPTTRVASEQAGADLAIASSSAPFRAPTPAPISAELEAPAYPASGPVVEEKPRGERSIRTDVAEPLRYSDGDPDEVAPPRRHKGALIAIGVVAVASLVIFIAVRSGKSDDPVTPKPDETKIVMQADPPMQPPKLPDPEPPVDDPPVAVDPPVIEPPVVAVKKPDIKKPDVKRPDVKKPDATKPDVKPEIKPEKPPELPPDLSMTKKQVISAAALYSLYQSVGGELAQVAKINPTVAAAVELDYRRIQIQDAMANEDTRAKNGADLEKMRNRLAVAKTKKP